MTGIAHTVPAFDPWERVDRDLLRGYVSRLWARDWDCTADAVYDT